MLSNSRDILSRGSDGGEDLFSRLLNYGPCYKWLSSFRTNILPPSTVLKTAFYLKATWNSQYWASFVVQEKKPGSYKGTKLRLIVLFMQRIIVLGHQMDLTGHQQSPGTLSAGRELYVLIGGLHCGWRPLSRIVPGFSDRRGRGQGTVLTDGRAVVVSLLFL